MREPAARLPMGPPRPRWRPRRPETVKRSVLVAFAFFAAALVLYAPGLSHPETIVFDEIHYLKVARHHADGEYVNFTVPERALPYNYEHPPLAKYFLFASMSLFGDNPVGWRLPSLLAGAAGVAGAYVLGRRLFESETAGVAAATLLLLDNQYYAHSGLAMLEVFPTAFSVWAFALALGPDNEARASAVVYGMALACKYNAVFLMPLFLALHWLRAPVGNPYLRGARALGWAVAVPLGVWLVTYLPMFVAWAGRGGAGYAAAQFVLTQFAAFGWDFGADATHPYSSHPVTWIAMARPVHYYAQDPGPGVTAHIYSIGNPVVWWAGAALAVVALTWVPWRMLKANGRVLLSAPFWTFAHRLEVSWTPRFRWLLAGLLFFFSWAPYLLLQRITFHYYMTFSVPYFAVLAGGAVAVAVRRGGRWAWAAYAFGALAFAVFAFYVPFSEGFAIPRWWYEAGFWLIPWMRP